MTELTSGFKARLEYVLDQACLGTPGGGSHEMRSFVAEKLLHAVAAGERSVENLIAVARHALDVFDQKAPATA